MEGSHKKWGVGGLTKTTPVDIEGLGYNPPNRFIRSLAPLIPQPLCAKPCYDARWPTVSASDPPPPDGLPPSQAERGVAVLKCRPVTLTPTLPWGQSTLDYRTPVIHPRKPLPPSTRDLTSHMSLPFSSPPPEALPHSPAERVIEALT